MNKQTVNFFPTRFWHKEHREDQNKNDLVTCDVCPHHCHLREGKRGICYVRMNHHGKIVLTSYGRSSGFCIDPIEKKPLNHFYPGSRVMSFGTAGCNLSCKFCQNWEISKSREVDIICDTAMPEQLALVAKNKGCKSLAFTYNDPVIFMEYAIDVALAAKALGLKSVAVSAGYICNDPRVEFFRHMDAVNIDLKSFSENFYHKICHGHLQPVLDTLLYLKYQTSVWFEITTLLIPDENDSDQELHQMCQWIAENLGQDVPLHFSAFHPDFKMMDKECTPLATLLRARKIALSYGLHYVYCGNVHNSKSESTYCPNCQHLLIERDWYMLGEYHLDQQGHCLHCGQLLPGRFAGPKENFGRRRIPIRVG